MYLYISQKGKKFIYRNKIYDTPVELSFAKESISSILSKLKIQHIIGYQINPTSNKEMIPDNKETIYQSDQTKFDQTKSETVENITAIDILNKLGVKIDNLDLKVSSLNLQKETTNNISINRNNIKLKDNVQEDEDKFIPSIDTGNMSIKSNIKTEKSNVNHNNVDILKELLKGI